VSTEYSGDSSPSARVDSDRPCLWCRQPLEATQLRWCSKRCRQTAWRARKLASVEAVASVPKRLAYADPPFPGCARYYRDQPTYAGEVDHGRLLEQLATYDGWALSTSRKALRDVLSLVHGGDIIVAPWVKVHPPAKARGPSNVHEYVIVSPARRRMPGPPDALVAAVARGGDSDLIGRKPLRFVFWVFDLLGASPGDELDDLFPGSGVVSRCWDEFSRAAPESPRTSATAAPGDGDADSCAPGA
jgi:hypothetical protein